MEEEQEFNQFTEKDGIVTINDGVTEIPHEVFFQHEMKGLVIPGSVTTIGPCAFSHCENLTSVVLSEGVTSLGPSCFDSCTSLTTITIPTSLKTVETNAFCFTRNITEVIFNGTEADWKSIRFKTIKEKKRLHDLIKSFAEK